MSCRIKSFIGVVFFFILLLTADRAEAVNIAVFKVNSNIYQSGGQSYHMDVAPYIKEGRVYLPLRYAARAAGISDENIFWNDAEKSVTLIKGSRTVRFVVNRRSFTVNGVSISMDASPEIVSGRTMLPVRYVAQSMGLVVSWDGSGQIVSLDTPTGQGKKTGSRNPRPVTYDAGVKISLLDQLNYNIVSWVNEEANYKYAGHIGSSLAEQAKKDGYDYFRAAELALSFVGGAIPYKEADLQLPAQTLVDDGDCDCKSVLLAAILKNMGYKVALLKYPTHAAVGIAFDDHQIPKDRELLYYNYNGIKYYFCETTTAGWTIGRASDKIEKTATVFPVD